ncbi:MAG: hypothetical protein M3395_08370 [Chloroflexota bacterium]|nr:hypothetical protein [Chloroflexota bacterium]
MIDERTTGQSAPNGLLGRMRGARGTVLRLATVKLKRPAAAMRQATPESGRIHGVSDAAADRSECRCPDFCERDHANE